MAKFQDIESAYTSLNKKVEENLALMKQYITIANSQSKGQADLTTKIKSVEKATDSLTDLEKQRISLAKQTKKVFAQNLAFEEKKERALIKGNLLLKKRRAALKEEITGEKAAAAAKKASIAAQRKLNKDHAEAIKINNKLNQSQKKQTSFTQKLNKAFTTSLLKITAVIAAVKGLIAVGKAYIANIKEVNSQTTKTQQSFDITRERAVKLTKSIRAIAAAFDQDFNDVLKSSNILSKEFGVTGNKALKLIESGFRKGANINGEFLELLKEYPAQLRAVGLSAEQSIALITQTEQQGLFSDKGIDAIKEAGIRLRELTPATESALEAIGLSGAEIQRQLRNGEKTLFEVTQDVSEKLSELPPQSKEVGTAIADIFGGPGEDVGLTFLTTLKDIDLELNNIKTTLSPVEKSSASLKEQWRGFVDEVAKGEGVASRVLGFIQNTLAVQLKIAKEVLKGKADINEVEEEAVAEESERIKAKAAAAAALAAEELRIRKQLAADQKKIDDEVQQEKLTAFQEFKNKREAEESKADQESIERQKAQLEKEFELQQEAAAKEIALAQEVADEEEALRQKKLKLIGASLDFIGNSTQVLFDRQQSLAESEISNLEMQKEAEVAAAEKAGKDTSKIEEKYAKKEAQLRTEQAKKEKQQSLFTIGIKTAQAIVAAAAIGPPQNIPFIAFAAALGAVQLAAVAATPIPKFKHGTDGQLQLDTTAIVGDGGKPELVTTPQGSFISPAKDTMVHLPRGSQVFGGDSPETQAALSGGMTEEMYNGLVNEQRLTRKAIQNQPKEIHQITGAGYKFIIEKNNHKTIRRDKYFG